MLSKVPVFIQLFTRIETGPSLFHFRDSGLDSAPDARLQATGNSARLARHLVSSSCGGWESPPAPFLRQRLRAGPAQSLAVAATTATFPLIPKSFSPHVFVEEGDRLLEAVDRILQRKTVPSSS
jgi:hypothetical protein